jgi:hypothetical protein
MKRDVAIKTKYTIQLYSLNLDDNHNAIGNIK